MTDTKLSLRMHDYFTQAGIGSIYVTLRVWLRLPVQ